MAQEGALREERADFIRAVLANELSVKVLRKFLETEVPNENDRLSNKWWTTILPTNLKGFQVEDIKTKQPQEWDMTVLAFAIRNCLNLVKDKKDAVKKMKDKRNVLSHKPRAKYAKPEFNQLFIDLDKSYTSLLGESEARRDFCEELKKVKEKQIYDESIEEILVKRDEELHKAEEREEEMMRIHTKLLGNIIRRVKQMKDKIGELKDCTAHAHDLATDFDFDFDWIIGILTTTVPKGSDGAGVQADGPDPVPQERVFEEKDLYDILTLTQNAAHKWTFIGLALGFKKGNLNLIEQNVMIFIRGPRALYTEMLSDWLRWAPPKHPLPTSTALAAALRSDTVEEDLLASDIEKKFGGGPEE